MSSFEIGASRSVGAVQQNSVQPSPTPPTPTPTTPTPSTATSATTSAAADVQTSVSASAGPAPIDQDRVDQIRQAVSDGTYPLIPARIGDAMIAAGAMLRRHA